MHRARHKTFTAMALTASLLLAACGTTTTGNGDTAKKWSSVIDQEWYLAQVKQSNRTLSPTSPVIATATFSADGMVSGNDGCNQYSGSYKQSGSSLGVAQLAMTRKFCTEEDAMKVENAFSGAFVMVSRWDLIDGYLVLKDHNGNTAIKLTPARP